MTNNASDPRPDNTAVRTALWRALHLIVDDKPFVIEDNVGFRLISPDDSWRERPVMHPEFTKRLRASMVARARFIEDLICTESAKGVSQYVLLGAGLDSFAQRRPDLASKLQIFEIDQPETQQWKMRRLEKEGYGVAEWLHFVSVDFEITNWWDQLLKAGFDPTKPAVVACTGVTLYLTKEAIDATLTKLSALAPGSTVAMTFYLPTEELVDEEDKFLQQISEKGARESGTPFVSFFSQDEIPAMGMKAGFKMAEAISTKDMHDLYFRNRADNFTPASGEIFLVAST